MKIKYSAVLSIILSLSFRLWAQSPTGYTEQTAMDLLETIEGTPFVHTESPEAQWYPQAGLGLFIHWGIHSVAGGDPSWSMLSNVPWLTTDVHVAHDKYYRLADEFDPSNYDPEEWARTAKETGFTYMVITVKHHDGYCLWPSNYGEYNTLTKMHGRDLVGPLVKACRKYGLKIGLYFSPRDWSYPDYPVQYIDWDYANRRHGSPYPPEENQRKYDGFFRYTCGQMSEILTRYGKIDVLWFDGIGWPGVNTHHDVLHSWLRALQPGMVVNPRWEVQGHDVNFGQTTEFGAKAPFGDFRTEEVAWRKRMEEGRPYPYGEWWEYNEPWSGHWGYSPGARFRDFDSVIAALVYARSFGGNYLPDIGPQPDGGMRPAFYSECAKLKAWMEVNGQSVIGTGDYPDWKQISNHPLTIAPKDSGDVTYAHFLKGKDGHLEMKTDKKPLRAVLLADGSAVPFKYKKKVLTLDIPDGKRGGPCEVVKIVFSEKPASFNAMGDDVVIVEADYPAGEVPARVRALSAKMAPSTVQGAPGGRYVFIVKASEKDRLVADLLEEKMPIVTVFEHPFYNFNREKATGEAPQELLSHAVMTCNMVADPVKQAEYLDYHARQGELFPEVARGFARAGYEQVLVFRDGRRLMLIISFPQGSSLSELDPLTTRDNPRVDDWNAIMAGYQENIDSPGEPPWVMFEPY